MNDSLTRSILKLIEIRVYNIDMVILLGGKNLRYLIFNFNKDKLLKTFMF